MPHTPAVEKILRIGLGNIVEFNFELIFTDGFYIAKNIGCFLVALFF